MTFAEVERQLPNGFHDARLKSYAVDSQKSEMILSLDFWVGDDKNPEAYRSGRFLAKSLQFLTIDPPGPGANSSAKRLSIDAGSGQPVKAPNDKLIVVQGASLVWIWVAEWNGYMRFAAKDFDVRFD
jgi:hypothetical protein